MIKTVQSTLKTVEKHMFLANPKNIEKHWGLGGGAKPPLTHQHSPLSASPCQPGNNPDRARRPRPLVGALADTDLAETAVLQPGVEAGVRPSAVQLQAPAAAPLMRTAQQLARARARPPVSRSHPFGVRFFYVCECVPRAYFTAHPRPRIDPFCHAKTRARFMQYAESGANARV